MLEQGMLNFALLGASWVLWLLVFMSIGVIAVSLERAVFMLRSGSSRGPLASALDAFVSEGDRRQLHAQLANIGGTEARVILSGLEVAAKGTDAAEKAMASTSTAEKLRMERGLAYLATVGSNAPFVGLFGTVLGIIKAFHDLALDVGSASEAVMAGISQALVSTAVGLLVAIPAVVLYNLLARWVKGRLARSASVAELVLAHMEGTDG